MIGSNDFFKVSTIRTDDKNVIPNFPVVIIALDGFLEYLPSPRFLPLLNVSVGQIVPSFEILPDDK